LSVEQLDEAMMELVRLPVTRAYDALAGKEEALS
jgi:hypothetical protein